MIISDGQLVRWLERVLINVYCKGPDGTNWRLRQGQQISIDGRTRTLNRPEEVTEKAHPGEQPKQTAIRAIEEELDIHNPNPKLTFLSQNVAPYDSISFPGLNTLSISYYYQLDLKPSDFKEEGCQEIRPDKTTYFYWERVE